MFDIISIGSSLVDVFVFSDKFSLDKAKQGLMLGLHLGDKIEIDGFELFTGGGGGNTAVAFSRLGFRVAVVTETGRDVLSELVMSDFHKEQVDTNMVIQEKKERTGGSVVLVNPGGDRTILVHRGASSLLDPEDLPVEKLERASWVHLSSISGRHETLTKIFSIRRTAKRVSWNPGKKELMLLAEGVIKTSRLLVEIMVMNRQEWQLVQRVQESLLAEVPIIVVTDGKAGGEVFSRQGSIQFQSSGVAAVDATGAGDAFSSGFVGAYVKGYSIEECTKIGIKNSSSVVQHIGAKPGLLRKSQLF